jgi:hypothetical protein
MPQDEDVYLVYEEFDAGFAVPRMGRTVRTFSPKEQGRMLRCSNPLCYRGGYDIGSMTGSINPDRPEIPVHMHCEGDEGMPGGRKLGRSCLWSIKGTLRIQNQSLSP